MKKYVSILNCDICKKIPNNEYAMQKHGWEEDDTFLSDGIDNLVAISDEKQAELKRRGTIMMCPKCKTYYLYDSGYDFLVNGSEDWQELSRMTPTDVRFMFSEEEYEKKVMDIVCEKDQNNATFMAYRGAILVDFCIDKKDFGNLLKQFRDQNNSGKKGMLARIWELMRESIHRQRVEGITEDVKKFLEIITAELPEDLKCYVTYINEHCK